MTEQEYKRELDRCAKFEQANKSLKEAISLNNYYTEKIDKTKDCGAFEKLQNLGETIRSLSTNASFGARDEVEKIVEDVNAVIEEHLSKRIKYINDYIDKI